MKFGPPILAFAFSLGWPWAGYAQNTNEEISSTEIEQVLELISENQEIENLDFTTLLDDLTYYYHHPLNLNFATREDLAKLVLLDEIQIQKILEHREATGRFESVYELQAIEGLDRATLHAILPFVSAGATQDRRSFNPKDILQESKNEAFIRHQRTLEEMEGYSPPPEPGSQRYLGSPDKALFRYRFKYYDNLSIGITAEKDAGEEFLRGSQPNGFDFYSAHLYLGNFGKLKHFAIGDYQVQFGQGLTYWSGLAFGKSGNIASVARSAREISPHVSAEENNFMRGTGATLQFGRVEATAFVSRKKVDANVEGPDTALTGLSEGFDPRALQFSSIQTSGFHRTANELADKNSIFESNAGGHIRYKANRFEIGGTYVFTEFGGSYNRNTSFYNQFENTDQRQANSGADYKLYFRNLLFFGEAARSSNGGTAFLQGVVASLAPSLDMALLYRNYSVGYTSLRSTAFSESTRNSNEKGLYTGINARLGKLSLNGYYDLFRFPWLRFRVDAPSFGSDYLAQATYVFSKTFKIYGRYRTESKPLNFLPEGSVMYEVRPLQKHWYRVHLDYKISPSITLRNRVEWVRSKHMSADTSHGFMVYQDFNYKSMNFPVSFNLRFALFETDGYDSRIYAYENDVLYSFSVPAFYGKGIRFYLVLKYRASRFVDLSFRVAQTFYANATENGSALNTVQGPHRTEVKTQLRVRF